MEKEKTKTRPREISFRVLGKDPPIKGVVRDGTQKLGNVLRRLGSRLGLAGSYEALDGNSQVISVDTPLADLPDSVTLAPELTPA